MVFNWFNRFKKQDKKSEPELKPPETPVEVSPPPGEEAEPYYMRLAREIQRKEEQKVDVVPVAEPTPMVEPLQAEIQASQTPKAEINEDVFDWQKILYGSNTPAPVVEAPIETWVQPSTPVFEKPIEPPVVAPTAEVPVPAEAIIDPMFPVAEIALPALEKPLESPIPATTLPSIEKPLEASTEVPLPVIEKPIETIAEAPTPLIEKTVEIVPEFPVPIQAPTLIEPPVVAPIAEVLPSTVEPSTPTAEPPPQPEQPATPFWKRILGQRSFYTQPPTPTPEIPTPSPTPEVQPPTQPVVPVDEVLPEVVLPSEPPAESEAVPFWQRILGQRSTPAPVVPETLPSSPENSTAEALPTPREKPTSEPLPIPREKPTTQPQPAQFDVGFLWSAEVLAAQGRRPEDVTLEEISWLQKLRLGLGRTRRGLVNNIKAVVGRGPLGAQEIEELEELLLQADVGIGVSEKILDSLQARVKQEALPPDQAMTFLKNQLRQQVELKGDDPAKFAPLRDQLNIWLIVGVNGVGKTTTIGKLASLASRSGYRTMIAAGDTFRAGAVSQVQIWANRSNVPVISNPSPNADPASVVFDAIGAARARNIELLIVDTAGRLQNKKNLMDELAKIRRIIDKQGTGAHVESLLVLDSTTGQNGLQQAKVFTEVASLTGVVLTKLDGSSKGGIALAIVDELKLPIRFVGVGEKVDDLRPFNSYEFIEALLSDVED